MTTLVITADDFGLDPRRDLGILEAFRVGAVTRASLLVTGPSAAAAVHEARAAGLPLGLHLDLTETAPSAPVESVASLLDERGRKLGKHGLRAAIALGHVSLEEVEAETAAQLACFAELVGAPATHVDGHQHIHVEPALVETLAAVFARHGVKTTRIPEETSSQPFYAAVNRAASRARAIYAAHGIASAERFIGLNGMGYEMREDRLRETVSRFRGQSSVELMCHPGYAGTGWDEFNESPAREHELATLLKRPFDAFVAQGWLKLSFSEGATP